MAVELSFNIPRSSFEMRIDCQFHNGTSGIFGHSGAGKTSLFNCLAGLETPKKGKIALDDKILFDNEKNINLPPYKRNIGIVFQDKLLFPHMSVKDNITFGEKKNRKSQIAFNELVELLDIKHILNEYPIHISGGETQRTAIARALFSSPDLLMFDEPFNAVDQNLRKSILPYLKKIQGYLNIPMLIISHDLPDIQKLTNTIFVMNQGRIYGGKTISELLESPNMEEMFDLSAFTNTVEIEGSVQTAGDLFQSNVAGTNIKIVSPYRSEDQYSQVLFLSPHEIILSKSAQNNISIQNQIECTISKIIPKEHLVYVILNSGLNIIAEITHYSFNSMGLKPGDRIYALFKARSLKVG